MSWDLPIGSWEVGSKMSFSYFDVTLDGQKSLSKYTKKFQQTDANPTKSSRQKKCT